MDAQINTPLEDCDQFIYNDLEAADTFEEGQVELIGASLLAICVEEAAGATGRAADLAAAIKVRPDQCTMVTQCDDVTILKTSALAIDKGDIVYWDVAEGVVNKTASGNHACGIAFEDAANPSANVRISFEGKGVVGATAGA